MASNVWQGRLRPIVIAVGSLVLALGIWAIFFRGSDEDAVRKVVARLSTIAKVDGVENPVMRATRVRSEVHEVFAPDAKAIISELSEAPLGRDGVLGAAMQAPQLWATVDLSISGVRVQIDPPLGAGVKKSARVDALALLSGARHGGTNDRDTRRIAVRLEERDGAFRIVELTVYPPD